MAMHGQAHYHTAGFTLVPMPLWGVTAFFDPVGQPELLANLRVFSQRVRAQGLPLLVVELAFGDRPFQVSDADADRVERLRSSTVLWHKERLINLGVAALPASCEAVAWLDGDVLFEHDGWVAESIRTLDEVAVLQPYDRVCWLGPGERSAPAAASVARDEPHHVPGFAATLRGETGDRRRWLLAAFERHGHTGFAWVARRDVVSDGLYDRAVLGGGDIINAHAMAGDDDFLRGRNLYCRWMSVPERGAVERWGRDMARRTGGRLGVVPGRILHLFHGAIASRRYVERLAILRDEVFDPEVDIAADASGCWRWATSKASLHERVGEYFKGRQLAAGMGSGS